MQQDLYKIFIFYTNFFYEQSLTFENKENNSLEENHGLIDVNSNLYDAVFGAIVENLHYLEKKSHDAPNAEWRFSLPR